MSLEKEIIGIYKDIKDRIESRLEDFKEIGEKGSDEEIFEELVFCLLTPQSKAKVCLEAVNNLKKKNLILKGKEDKIANELKGVRFKFNKSRYIVEARKTFTNKGKMDIKNVIESMDVFELREYLVRNVKGMGWKEASHFLRNIGKGDDIAILDRHILKNLVKLGVINEIPKTLTKKKYLEIENKMRKFSNQINIPLSHLDLVLWYKEAGDIIK